MKKVVFAGLIICIVSISGCIDIYRPKDCPDFYNKGIVCGKYENGTTFIALPNGCILTNNSVSCDCNTDELKNCVMTYGADNIIWIPSQ